MNLKIGLSELIRECSTISNIIHFSQCLDLDFPEAGGEADEACEQVMSLAMERLSILASTEPVQY